MKFREFIYLFIIICFISCGNNHLNRNINESDLIKEGLKGNVKLIEFSVFGSNGSLLESQLTKYNLQGYRTEHQFSDPTIESINQYIFKYDQYGNKAETIHTINGKIIAESSFKWINLYDNNGNLVKLEEYDYQGVLSKKLTWLYTDDGIISMKHTYNNEDKLVLKDSFIYNKDQQLIENFTFNYANELQIDKRAYSYNENGKINTVYERGHDERFNTEKIYNYDNQGNLIELKLFVGEELIEKSVLHYNIKGIKIDSSSYFYSAGYLHSKDSFKFNEKGNEVEYYSPQRGGYIIKGFKEYNDEGNLIEKKLYKENGINKQVYSENGYVLENSFYSSDSILIDRYRINYEFDSNSNLILEQRYENEKLMKTTKRKIEYHK